MDWTLIFITAKDFLFSLNPENDFPDDDYFSLIQTGILYIAVPKLSQSSVFLLVSFVFIIQHLLSDKAITAPQTHESNTNSVQIPTLSGYLLCKQSVYIPAAS